MSDQAVNFSGTVENGQSQGNVNPDQAAPENTTPQAQPLITAAEAEVIAERAAAKAFRGIQSAQEKLDARIRTRMDDFAAKLEAGGIEMTPEQAQKIQNQVIQEESQQLQNDPGTTGEGGNDADAQAQPPPKDEAEQVNQFANDLMAQYGVQLLKGDPEADMVDHSSPTTFKETFQAALDAKKAKLGASQVSPAAQVPTMGAGARSGNPIRDIVDPGELYQLARPRN